MTPSSRPYPKRSVFSRWLSFWRQKELIGGYPEGRGVFSSSGLIPGTRKARELFGDGELLLLHANISFLSRVHADKRWWYRASVRTLEGAAVALLESAIEERMGGLISQKGYSLDGLFAIS